MKEEHRFWLKIIVFFLILGLITFIVISRFKLAIDNAYQSDRDYAVATQFEERVKRFKTDSERYNDYACNSGDKKIDAKENKARCIVETRTKDQQTSYDQILAANDQIANSSYYSQTRTGFSDGIYGDNNFAQQYQVQGTIEENTVYQYQTTVADFDSSYVRGEAEDYLNQHEVDHTSPPDQFTTLLNPQAKYKTLVNAGLANQYAKRLMIGDYPEDGTNQVLIPLNTASDICSRTAGCSYIDQLVNMEFPLELTGYLPDGSISTITAKVKISGVYFGKNYYNDIILAYDGLNPSEDN